MDSNDIKYELDINPKEVCRLCLESSNNFSNIFSNSIVDGYIISMPEIMQYTLEIKVNGDDEMPDKICNECKQQMVMFYTFKKKSKRIEQSLRSMFAPKDSNLCTICNQYFINEVEFVEHIQNEHNDVYIVEESVADDEYALEVEPLTSESATDDSNIIVVSQAKAPMKKEIKTEVRRSTRNEAKKRRKDSYETLTDDAESVDVNEELICDSCTRSFANRKEWEKHECKSATDDSIKSESNDLFCVPCNKRLRNTHQYEQHTKMHDAMSLIVNYIIFYPCHNCRLIFISGESLAAHMNGEHPTVDANAIESGDSKVENKKIDDTCTDYQFLEDDRDDELYQSGPYSCGHCQIEYESANDLKFHAIMHSKKFPCPIYECGCEYDQLSRLNNHVINKHINMKELQCLHCGEAFPSYDSMQAHIRNDCKEKKFQCHECDKKFFSKKALITHLRTIKVKKYKCENCEKTFKQQGELIIHLRSHTNERPFQCTLCSKRYKTSSMRAAHMDSHIAGKTFECTLCDTKLQSRTSYRNHMKRHTEKKKHECEVCGKKFFTKFHMKLHATKVHYKIQVTNETENDNDTMT